ncbi:hypothetical protein [Brevibacterium aurantiacum]|uniref:hypothetical protein n=1 Tax=Brevibacterium aurantiacum TaxID=273384 RepID=UPI001C90590A|nr:hypothetical protein [Brevibacterium aurantiacum]
MTNRSILRKLLHLPPSQSDTQRPVPLWILRLAYTLPWLLLPPCLWRLPFAFHFEMGMQNQGTMPALWMSIPYVFGLSISTELAALLCIGLVRRWGEVAPTWLPLIGGRPVPALAAVVPAFVGGLALTALFTGVPVSHQETLTLAFGVQENVVFINGWWHALAAVCTAPLQFWGPIVLVLAFAYHLRRRAPAVDHLGEGAS